MFFVNNTFDFNELQPKIAIIDSKEDNYGNLLASLA